MNSVQCAYCTDNAVGYDEDDEPTCDSATCSPSVRPIGVVEVSAEDDGDES